MLGNRLEITEKSYLRKLKKVDSLRQSDKERAAPMDALSSVDLIPLDLTRTFPVLAFFNQDGPLHDQLKQVLEVVPLVVSSRSLSIKANF